MLIATEKSKTTPFSMAILVGIITPMLEVLCCVSASYFRYKCMLLRFYPRIYKEKGRFVILMQNARPRSTLCTSVVPSPFHNKVIYVITGNGFFLIALALTDAVVDCLLIAGRPTCLAGLAVSGTASSSSPNSSPSLVSRGVVGK